MELSLSFGHVGQGGTKSIGKCISSFKYWHVYLGIWTDENVNIAVLSNSLPNNKINPCSKEMFLYPKYVCVCVLNVDRMT